jgi:hypothetical protein
LVKKEDLLLELPGKFKEILNKHLKKNYSELLQLIEDDINLIIDENHSLFEKR